MGWFSNLFGIADEQAKGDALDAQLYALNTELYGPGGKLFNPETWATVQAHMNAGDTGWLEGQILGAGALGASEVVYNPSGWWTDTAAGAGLVGEAVDAAAPAIGNFGNGIGKKIWQAIPWWVWLLLLGFIGYKLGLFDLAKRKIATI